MFENNGLLILLTTICADLTPVCANLTTICADLTLIFANLTCDCANLTPGLELSTRGRMAVDKVDVVDFVDIEHVHGGE